ncbi:MAG: hypothetical protein RLZZ188_1745 [Verrucomicrobiota bacterium]
MNHTRNFTAIFAGIVLIGACCSAGCSRAERTARLTERIDRSIAAGDLAAAEIECRNLLQLDANNAGALRRLGFIYWDQGRELRAAQLLRAAHELEPDDPGTKVRLSRFLLACGDARAATDEATAALRLNPADADAPLILAAATAPDPDSQRRTRDLLHGLPSSSSAPVLVALGILDLRAGRTAAAEAAFHHALRTDPGFASAHHAVGMLRWGKGDLAGAADSFRSAAEVASPRSTHPLTLARFLAQTGKAEEAERVLAESTRQTPDHLPSWIQRAELAASRREYSSAEAHLRETLRRDPGNPPALAASARISLTRGDPKSAVATLERLRTLHPMLPQAGYELALAYTATGDPLRAEKLLEEVAKTAPALREAALARAELSLRRGDHSGAGAILEPLARENPDLPAARALLAAARWGEGRHDEAIALCLELERALPTDPQAPYWRGIILAAQGRAEEARRALERARELAPENFAILERLVEVEVAAGQMAAAIERLEAEMNSPSPRLETALLLARIRSISGNSEEAERILVAAIGRHEGSPVAHYALALLRHTSGRDALALTSARRALELQPRSAAAALLVAKLLERQGDTEAARAAYETVLTLKPDDPGVLTALASLLLLAPSEPVRARALAERAYALRPEAPAIAGALGSVLRAAGEEVRALPLLRAAAQALPANGRLQLELALTLLATGDDEGARAGFRRVLDALPPGTEVQTAREALAVLELPVDPPPYDALPMLSRRIATGHGDPATRLRLASILAKQGKLDDALRHLESALASAPSHAGSALLAARILADAGRPADAIARLKSARAGAPGDGRLNRALGRLILDETSDHPWALGLLEEAARGGPADAAGAFDLARALYANGRIAESLQRLDAIPAAELSVVRASEFAAFQAAARAAEDISAGTSKGTAGPPHSDPGAQATIAARWFHLRAALARGDEPEALRIAGELAQAWLHFTPGLREALRLHVALPTPPAFLKDPALRLATDPSTDPATRRNAGLILCRLDEHARGAAVLEAALAVGGADAEALLELGRACLALGRDGEGREFLRRALAADPSPTLAAAARAALGSDN